MNRLGLGAHNRRTMVTPE